jgi:ribosomal protein S18 acetylase RimI-like enzyme
LIRTALIRTARVDEIEAIVALWSGAGLQVDTSAASAELASLLAAGTDLMLVDERDSTIVGTVLGTWDGRRGWVQRLATLSDWRSQGVASGLLDELERRLLDRGCRKLNLLIEPDNASVVAFYQRAGFTTDELIFMEKRL